MSSLKINSKLSKFLHGVAETGGTVWRPKANFVTATSRLSEAKKDKETEETCQNVDEAANAVKDGAKAVKSAAESVTTMTKEVKQNFTATTAESITDKAAKIIKDKIVGK